VAPYVGEWSNGRGEVMVVTAKKMKYGKSEVTYTDITKATDGNSFQLKVNVKEKMTIFSNFLFVEMLTNKTEMKIKGYDTHAALMEDAEGASEDHWYRDN